MEPLVAVDRVVKTYGARTALAGVSFVVRAGAITGLLGPNGAGKSTTISIIATLLEADSGMVTVGGHRLPGDAAAARRVLGLVPQRLALYPTLTARENLRFFARMQGLRGAAARAAVDDALALVALDGRADEPVAQFSGGMKRRLNLAAGILHRPRIILLDEPGVGVDPQSRERIFEAIQGLVRSGAAVLYSTHYMEEAERLCDDVVLLDDGHVVASGTPGELVVRTGMTTQVHLRTARPLPAGWCDAAAGARVVGDARGPGIAVAVDDDGAVSRVLAAVMRAGGDVVELSVHHPNLADAFFRLTGRALRDEDGAKA
ncbi:MAG: ABC transporter ATP-binding protein [Deltaproteobacteria bacterium]|nr:MAG: ABC transporter ATP-binding protein [Deltaproteobacteria bacterium]